MKFVFTEMENKYAGEILIWKYKGEYSFYDMEFDKEDLEDFLKSMGENHWKDKYSVLDEYGNLIGFFNYAFANDCMEIGFGLKPDLTGRRIGKDFVLAGIEFGMNVFERDIYRIKLAVASFNIRAIKLYTKLGFKEANRFTQVINDDEYEFINMVKVI